MRQLSNLEIHLVHSCNLSCESCSHYSNQGHKGILSLEEAERWMGPWSDRLKPAVFSLLGGEPSIHPRLPEFVPLARRYWPDAMLRLVTNGFFLNRHPALPEVLREHPNHCLCLSIHHANPEYQEKIQPILDLVSGWVTMYGIRVEYYHSYRNWTRRYRGFGSEMQPFEDQEPRRSWECCPAKYCPQILEGKIWKCGPLAYLTLQDAKYGLSEKWAPYLGYQPLEASCSEEELHEFFDREDETYCAMCPAQPERFDLPVPLAADHG